MEKTYTHKITTLEGAEQEVTINRLTVRHGLKLQGKDEAEIIEVLFDLVAPGVLDIISIDSLAELSAVIMEKEKGFFDQMAGITKKVIVQPEIQKEDLPSS